MVTDRNGRVYYPDNARTQTSMYQASYYEPGRKIEGMHSQRIALRLTPDSYPKRLAALGFGTRKMDKAKGVVTVGSVPGK